MRLLELRVEHFRCIQKAEIEFGPGLNVLHGPNDLGKSSLAAAIRAVLLLQANSSVHEEFVNWSGSGVPHVELTFESEAQRIWRVRKTFGSAAQAYLDESRDGVDFHVEAKGREVDGRLSEILQWGLAPPGSSKGRPRGMPMTFLSTALLAEQDRVAAIFEQALSKDSDESGKNRLVEALKAVAEDPLYKMVLERVQVEVDKAFTANGGKRRGKESPWSRMADLVRQKEAYQRQCAEQLQKTAAIEGELQALHARQMAGRAAVETRHAVLEQTEGFHRALRQREEIAGRLNEAKTRLAVIRAEQADLSKAEEKRLSLVAQVEAAGKSAETARAAFTKAAQQAQAAKEEATRQQSEGAAHERQLKRAAMEKRQAEAQAEQLRTAATLERIRAVQAAAARVQTLEKESRETGDSLKTIEQKHGEVTESLGAVAERDAGLRAVANLIRCRIAREALQKVTAGLAQVTAWREEAAKIRATAAALEGSLAAVPLPSPALLEDFRDLDQKRQIADARVAVGLQVRIVPKSGLFVMLSRDGEDAVPYDLAGTPLDAGARREVRIEIEDVADIAITGGEQSARDEVERLRKRWLAEVEPALERANAVTLEHLSRMAADAAQRTQEIQEARRNAAQLEQRAADQPDWAAQRAQRQQELTVAEAALGQSDRASAEAMARKLRIADIAVAEGHLEKLRAERDKLLESQRKLEAELAGAKAHRDAKHSALSAARQELESSQTGLGGDWEKLLPDVTKQQGAIQTELAAIAKDLETMTAKGSQAVAAAKKALEAAEKVLVAAEADQTKTAEERLAAERQLAGADGEIRMRRESVAKLDESAARAAVAQVEAELQRVPEPPQRVTDEVLGQARAAVETTRDELRRIEDEVQAKRGALQHVGGEVARQKAEAAQKALTDARAKEQFQEDDFMAWALLRETLQEAEREEGVHLGKALGDPIARRFAELTGRRYGNLILGPDLETSAIAAGGEGRPVSALSVGTRDQLSTIFRLSLAEQLKTALMLDDQLTQSDADRMLWLRDLIRELAANIQILVFTCRPADYLLPAEMKASRKSDTGKPPVRSILLTQAIDRGAAGAVAE
jgi:DNA repair exonuclease SbcCD ATPase subunit